METARFGEYSSIVLLAIKDVNAANSAQVTIKTSKVASSIAVTDGTLTTIMNTSIKAIGRISSAMVRMLCGKKPMQPTSEEGVLFG